MPCRALVVHCIFLLSLAAATGVRAADDWVGDYLGIGGAASRMQITPAGAGRVEVLWTGGGEDSAGAATAASCSALAAAAIDAPTATALHAQLQPFRRGEAELDAADLAALRPGPIVLAKLDAAGPSAWLVHVSGGFPHCGLQTSLDGPYWRPAAATAAPHPLSVDFQRCKAARGECLSAEYARQDRRLNQGYQTVLARLGVTIRAALRQAQRRWLAERDRLCAASTDRLACLAKASAHRADEFAAVESAAGREAH